MRAKPDKRWVAHKRIGRTLIGEGERINAPTWFLARQAAAVLLRADPCDIDVRRAT